MTTETIRILIVDDHFVVRKGIEGVLSSVPDMEVVAGCADGRSALSLYDQFHPDIVIADLRMPGMNGIELTEQLMRRDPQARVIVLSTYDGDDDIHKALKAGAQSYVLKDVTGDRLVDVIRRVYRYRKTYITREMEVRLAARQPHTELTERELQVLRLIVSGSSNRQIGEALTIAEGTVKIHINNILNKLGVEDRTQASITAIQRGIVHLD